MPMTRSQIDSSTPPPGEVTQVVEHFFRHEAGKIVSTLTRIFGVEQLNRAEDVVQETFRALQTWPYYGDRLIEWDDSPVVALNGAVAVAHVHGPRAGIEAVEAIHDRQQLNCYYLLYAVLGEFEADLDHRQAAIKHFRKALELATMKSEQIFLTRKIQGPNDTDASEAQAPRRQGHGF